MGEGYHNFHHQFPMDYRNAFHWYQYDPTKWFIGLCKILGLASHLRVFPNNEIQKGILTMKLKEAKRLQDLIEWPRDRVDLPVWDWAQCKLRLVHEGLRRASLMLKWQIKRNRSRGH